MEILLILTALANAVSSILAWIAKIAWGKEYREAKDEIIKAKEAQIRTLQEHITTLEKLNPEILKRWYENGLGMAQTYVAQLDTQIQDAQKKIEILEADKILDRDRIEKANKEYTTLKADYYRLRAELDRGSLPTLTSVATSAANSTELARTTSTEPPPIGNELLKFLRGPTGFATSFDIDKACPKCHDQMLMNPDTGKYSCKCGYRE